MLFITLTARGLVVRGRSLSAIDPKGELATITAPFALVADAILDCSRRGDLVLDAFLGSGTTLIAAERTGRRGRLWAALSFQSNPIVVRRPPAPRDTGSRTHRFAENCP